MNIIIHTLLTLILPMWRIDRAPNKTSKLQMGFHLTFKGLSKVIGSMVKYDDDTNN
jgi:hypothetical protein